MEAEFEEFINERINNNYYKLRNNQKRKDIVNEYDKLYNVLYNELSKEQKKQLEELSDIKNSITDLESCFAYKIGLLDCLEFIYSFK